MKKVFFLGAGILVTFVGTIIFISPIPFGFAIVLPGLALLIMGSDSVADFLRRRRENNPKTDAKIREAKQEIPDSMHGPLEKTRPDDSQE